MTGPTVTCRRINNVGVQPNGGCYGLFCFAGVNYGDGAIGVDIASHEAGGKKVLGGSIESSHARCMGKIWSHYAECGTNKEKV